MVKHKYIGVYHIMHDSGIGIVEIDPYGDWVKFQWFTSDKVWKVTKAPLYSKYNIETKEDDFYFRSNRIEFYLKNFMRTDL
jgi:hypothetical protein